MLELRRVRAFGQRSLPFKMIDDLGGGFAANEGCEFFYTCFRDFMDRSEVAQQARLPFLADAGNRRQFRSEIAELATLAMISDGVAMRLVANHLNQSQYLRVRVEINRLILEALY